MDFLSVGDALRTLRLEKGYTQTYVASCVKSTKGLMSMYESNKRIPSRAMLMKLAELYDVTMDRIMYYSDDSAANIGCLKEGHNDTYVAVEPVPMYSSVEEFCVDSPTSYATYDNLLTDFTKTDYFYIKYEKGTTSYWALVENTKKIKPDATYLVKSGKKLCLIKTDELSDRNKLNILGLVKSLTLLF